MRTIIHHSGRRIYRCEDYIGICNDSKYSHCCAEILGVMEYWTGCRIEEIERVKGFNEQARKLKQPEMKVPDIWLYERISDFRAGVLNGYADTYIKKSLQFLELQGFIESKNSSNKFDRVKYYKLNISVIQKALDEWRKNAETPVVDEKLKITNRTNNFDSGQDNFDSGQDNFDSGQDNFDPSLYKKSLNSISQTINQAESLIPPISPKGDKGEGDADAIAAEFVEESQPEINATTAKTELPLNSRVAVNNSTNHETQPTNSLVLTTFPASENNSQNDFISYAGRKNLENGREYLPWQGIFPSQRKNGKKAARLDVHPGFVGYVIKRNSWMPHFQNKKGQELCDAGKTWIRNHVDEALGFWDDFNSPQPEEIPKGIQDISLKEAERQIRANQRRARLDEWLGE